MNKEVKELWIEALISDEFLQGFKRLASIDVITGQTKYCCLGVLCEIYMREHPLNKTKVNSWYCYDNNSDYLPDKVEEWSGVSFGVQQYLSDLNDGVTASPANFHKIADYIKAEL